ncbi:MAG TPA: 3-hydroxyacyl-CoA dehydrogenase family protein, partial [Gemmatimonadales bacterium]|nr:3-hydroxyacyl-CoA dehydrogenase family protein [Gemmatimonadales bacterium]
VHVIGAGAMGGDIGAWCAWHGLTVSLGDVKPEPIAGAIKRAAELYKKIGHKGTEIRDALDRLVPDLRGDGIRSADLVIEAASERLDLKQRIYAAAEQQMRSDAILATNTSSIALEQLREGLRRPDRFVGLHFFNPVPVMKLVEVVRTVTTSAETFDRAFAFAGKLGKEPIAAKDNSGFVVNLLLVPYLLDAIRALEHGVASVTDIDKAMQLGCGHPMGPFVLLDFVGLDTTFKIAEIMFAEYREQRYAPPPLLKRMVLAGYYGKKAGKGFYDYRTTPSTPSTLGL